MSGARWITEAEVVGLLSLEEALGALESGLVRLQTLEAVTIPKAMHAWGGGSVHSLGAFDGKSGLACFKNWINTPAGAVALLVLFDIETGALRAIIEAGALGAMRTSGVTALATRELSAEGADEAAILGSGRQAQLQLAAIALIRPPKRVRFWSPTPAKRNAAAEAASQRFGVNAVVCDTLEAATQDAAIIASVTRAREPFLRLDHIAQGAHLNAVGAILPGFAELEPNVLVAADILAADSVSAVSKLREVSEASALDSNLIARTCELSTLLSTPGRNRPAAPRLTAFKSLGIGASDLALAGEVLRRAERQHIGRAIDTPTPIAPRWRRS
jgi:alanine dehydrogenase